MHKKYLLFAYFLLAKQKEVTRPTGRNLIKKTPHIRSPLHNTQTMPLFPQVS